MVTQSERKSQQKKAAEFKARKKVEGKFGGITGKESPQVRAAIARALTPEPEQLPEPAPTVTKVETKAPTKTGLPPVFQDPFVQIGRGVPAKQVLREREKIPGLIKPKPSGIRTVGFIPSVGAAPLPPPPRSIAEVFKPRSEVRLAEEPKGVLEKARRKLIVTEQRVGKRLPSLAPVTSFGIGVGEGVIGVGIGTLKFIRTPITATKETAKFLTSPSRISKEFIRFGTELRTSPRPLGRLAGEFLGGRAIFKVGRKTVTTGARFAPGFEEVPLTKGLTPEIIKPSEVIKGTGKIPLFSATQFRTSKLFPKGTLEITPKVEKKIVRGFGAERKSFLKKTGEAETFVFFSPKRAALGFGFQPVKVKEFLTKTRRPRIVKLEERITPFKQSKEIKKALSGKLSPSAKTQLRAGLVREAKSRRGIFPGTKGAAGLGFEREAITTTPLVRKRGLIPSFTVEPFTERIVRILPVELKKTTKPKRVKPITELKQSFKKTPLKRRVKGVFEDTKTRKRIERELETAGISRTSLDTRRILKPTRRVSRPAIREFRPIRALEPSRVIGAPARPTRAIEPTRAIAPDLRLPIIETRTPLIPRTPRLTPAQRGLRAIAFPATIIPSIITPTIKPKERFLPSSRKTIQISRRRRRLDLPQRIFKPSLGSVLFKIKATPAEEKRFKEGLLTGIGQRPLLESDPISRRVLGLDNNKNKGGIF